MSYSILMWALKLFLLNLNHFELPQLNDRSFQFDRCRRSATCEWRLRVLQ